MRKESFRQIALRAAGLVIVSVAAAAQTPPATPAAGTAPSRSLGLFVYARERQEPTQQLRDEGECFAWAREQTGIDPIAPPTESTPEAASETEPSGSGGSVAKGAVKGAAVGAAAGTAIGAIAGHTGKGAGIGATAGLLGGIREARKAAKEAEKTAEAEAADKARAAAEAQAASVRQRRETFGRAFGACMDARGYTVR
jgi:hypothetical protein